ncbi:MAG: CBS domain-containing protein, partial [Paracoccaceae bacterium]
MGDIDGSSSAAQSAQSNETTHKKRTGFFGRLFSPKSADGDALTSTPHSQSSAPKLGLANLRRLRVEDVAIPKAEIIAVPDTMTKSELVDIFRSSTMTRLPVFSGTLDTPVGMVHLKDFALSHGFETEDHDFNLTQTLRPVLFVPPSMSLSVLLTKMQTERSHMALV